MKKVFLSAAVSFLVVSSLAIGSVTLKNDDSDSHDILIKCSSTSDSSISGSSSRDIGTGPCTVTVKSTGSSATVSDGGKLTISGGNVTAS